MGSDRGLIYTIFGLCASHMCFWAGLEEIACLTRPMGSSPRPVYEDHWTHRLNDRICLAGKSDGRSGQLQGVESKTVGISLKRMSCAWVVIVLRVLSVLFGGM